MDDITIIYLIAVVLLVILSALFACSETSVTAVSRAKIHRLANEGNKFAKKLEKLLKDRENLIGSMLIGNNAVNILASVLATSIFLKFFGEAGLIYATISMTLIVIIFAEIAPKNFALKKPDKLAIFLAPFISFVVKILMPFTRFIQKIVDFFINNFLVKDGDNSQEEELEEIRDTVDLKHKEGSIFKYDKDLIDGVLDLSDTELSEIMVHRRDIKSINIDLPIEEIITQALSIKHGKIPLWRDNKENIVAILSVRKLLKFLHVHKGGIAQFKLEEVTTKPWFVPATNNLRSQLFAFRKKRNRFALLVDEYGALLGLVTLEDIMEEIVGEIGEEGDPSEVEIIKVKSGAYKISGRTMIKDINKRLNWNLSEDSDAYNLTAFIIGNLERIPDERERFSIEEYDFEILKRRNHDLILVKVKSRAN